MALIICPECKREISSTADACPHCGRKPERSSPAGFAVALFLLAIGVTFLVGPLYGGGFFVVFGLIGSAVLACR